MTIEVIAARHMTAAEKRRIIQVLAARDNENREMKYVMDHVASGKLKAMVDKIFTLDQIVDAHRYMETNAQLGNIAVSA